MRSSLLIVLIAALLSMNALGQGLSDANRKIVEAARSRYYNLQSLGFQSATCSVNFDFSTIPSLPSNGGDADRKLLEATRFTLKLDEKGPPILSHSYPNGASDSPQQPAGQLTNLVTSLVEGMFQTWPTKGLQGPIPPFDSQIESVGTTDNGYRLTLRVPGAPVRIDMDKNYLVNEIVSAGGKIDERPIFAPSPEGLVFAGLAATDDTESGGRVEIMYELGNAIVDGLRLPNSAHLSVNKNIDVKFTLSGCSVVKAKVITLKP